MTAELRIPGVCHVCSFPVLSGGTLCRHCREAGEQDLPAEAPARPAVPDPSLPPRLRSEDSPISPEWDAITPPGRSLTDKIRDPSAGGLVAAFLLSVIPLTWPLFFYMALRYLTGHRHRVVSAGTAAASRRRTVHLAARQATVLVSLGTGALYAVWRIWPTYVPDQPGIPYPAPSGICIVDAPGVGGGIVHLFGACPTQPGWAWPPIPAFWSWPFAATTWPLILLEAVALAVIVFLTIATLRWAWRSFR